MPMDRKRYPKNWEVIALNIKSKARWICRGCQKQCLKPGEGVQLSRPEKAKLTLTVHHADLCPENNSETNLIPLCAPCHLALHSVGRRGNVSPGQLGLPIKIDS
jgi:predicted HNH restriction endonuclease